jgi:TRAP-type mannitol/chloroaromatic compound transport system permease small subunit
MTFGVGYEVFVRYLLRDPTSWALDISYIMCGTLFMMGGACTLSRDGHVYGDVLFRLWRPRVQASLELVLCILFFLPGMIAMVYAGITHAERSWRYLGVSVMSATNVPISPFKTIIPIAAAMLVLRGIAQVIRCVLCLRDGARPAHLMDVEEMETVVQHHKEDIAEIEHEIGGDRPRSAR